MSDLITDLVLACDLGTGGAKTVIFSHKGKVMAETVCPYQTYYPAPSYHEQKPQQWWAAFCQSVKQVLSKPNIAAHKIRAISISGHSLGCILIDKDKNLLLEDVPIWSDGRATQQAKDFFKSYDENEWYLQTGNGFPAPLYPLFKIMWYRQNLPEIFAKTHSVIGTKDYINYLLTGRIATDPSYASGTGFYDLSKKSYIPEILKAAGLDTRYCNEIIASDSVVGVIRPEISAELGLADDVVIMAGGVDNSCMALGSRTFNDGDLFLSMGSSSWLTVSAKKPLLDVDVRSYAFAHVVPNQIISATSIFSSGTTLNYISNMLYPNIKEEAEKLNISPYDYLEKQATLSPNGAHGLLMMPSLGGGTSLEGGPEVRGGYIGLGLEHKREDMLRAAYEGVAYGLRIALDELAKMTVLGNEIIMVGGGAKSPLWRQIFANIFAMNVVKTIIDQEASALGAAALGFKGLGLWKDYQQINTIHQIQSVSKPEMDSQHIYETGLRAYRLFAGYQNTAQDVLKHYRQA